MRFVVKATDNPREDDTNNRVRVPFLPEIVAMLHRNGRAMLSAALVADRRRPAIDRLVAARCAGPEPEPAFPLFSRKCASQSAMQPWGARPTPRRATRPRLSVRLTEEQLWRVRLAAAVLRQSCQAFLADALEGHVARIARDPAHALGAVLLDGAPAANG